MEGIIIFALGAGAAVLARRGRKPVKSAIGWVARQSGYIVSRVRGDIDIAKRVARDEFERARAQKHEPVADDVVPSERVAQVDGNGVSEAPR